MSTREEVTAKVAEYFGALDVAAAAGSAQADAEAALQSAQASLDTANANREAAVGDVEAKKQSLKEAIDNVT